MAVSPVGERHSAWKSSPVFAVRRPRYVLLQGPLAFEPHPELDAHLISVATAAQHVLFRSLAQELDGRRAHVVELVSHAFIRDRQTQPTSPVSGEALGGFVAYLLSGAREEIHGRSIHLRSPEQVSDLALGDAVAREDRMPSG